LSQRYKEVHNAFSFRSHTYVRYFQLCFGDVWLTRFSKLPQGRDLLWLPETLPQNIWDRCWSVSTEFLGQLFIAKAERPKSAATLSPPLSERTDAPHRTIDCAENRFIRPQLELTQTADLARAG
jgi:hypothetical protein